MCLCMLSDFLRSVCFSSPPTHQTYHSMKQSQNKGLNEGLTVSKWFPPLPTAQNTPPLEQQNTFSPTNLQEMALQWNKASSLPPAILEAPQEVSAKIAKYTTREISGLHVNKLYQHFIIITGKCLFSFCSNDNDLTILYGQQFFIKVSGLIVVIRLFLKKNFLFSKYQLTRLLQLSISCLSWDHRRYSIIYKP